MSLTPKQQQTLQDLRNEAFSKIQSNELSSLLNSVFNKNQSREIKKEVIKGGVEWFIKSPKIKNKDMNDLNKILMLKVKKLASNKSDVTTKQMRAEERELFAEVKPTIKSYEEFNEEEKNDKDDDEEEKVAADVIPRNINQPRLPAAAVPSGMTSADYRAAQMMADARAEQNAREINTQDDTAMDTLGKYIDFGSDYYKENKQTINKVMAALTPKKLKDGSYFTEITSLAYPEIAVFQKAINTVGLDFTAEDSALFEKFLSKDSNVSNEIPMGDRLGIVMKMLINPDQIGVLIKTRGDQMADDLGAWVKKVKGENRDLTPDEQTIADKIEKRRKKNEKKREREAGLDEWTGDTKPEPEPVDPVNPNDPIHNGGGKIDAGGAKYVPIDEDNMVVVDGDTYNPDNLSYEDVYKILIPPELAGYSDTTAAADFGRAFKDFFTSGQFKQIIYGNKDSFLTELEKTDPEAFAKYNETFNKYTKTINKAGLDRDGLIDYEISKDYIDNAKTLTEDLLKKAIASGDMDRETAGKLYDSWDIFNEVISGDETMTYAQMEELQKQLIQAVPTDILNANKDAIQEFMTNNAEALSPNWDGDSDLGDFGWLDNIINPTESEEDKAAKEEDVDGNPKEKKIPKKLPNVEPRYRYRGKWGNTDELFAKKTEEIERRNLILEVQKLRDEVDTTNRLIQSQFTTDKRRFDKCFEMPLPEYYKPKQIPEAFKKEHRAIFMPVEINPLRQPERNMRQEDLYGQYQMWSDRTPQSSSHAYLLKDPLIYPSNADFATGGLQKELASEKDISIITLLQNNRFGKA